MFSCNCHLHFWQNDQDFLRATVVTRGWNGYRNKSQHRKSTLEKKILPPFQQGFEPATFQSRVRCSNHWAIPAPPPRFNRTLIYHDIDNTMHIFREIPFFRPQNDTERTVKWLKTMKNDMRGEVTSLFVVVFSACRKNNNEQQCEQHSSSKHTKKRMLLHLSYHFSLFLTVLLLFKCRFVT